MQNSSEPLNTQEHIAEMLKSAVAMTELAMDLKERSTGCEKYSCYLRSLAWRAGNVILAMENASKSFLSVAQRLSIANLKKLEGLPKTDDTNSIRTDLERLLSVLERELMHVGDTEPTELSRETFEKSVSDKIKDLELKQKGESIPVSSRPSSKLLRFDFDEKYPESCWSRESIDANSFVGPPIIPEDIFNSLSNRPRQSYSFSSLQNLRRSKLRASDDSDSDHQDEVVDSKLQIKNAFSSLANILEETF